ncbi:MAG: hypothetical protein IIY71_01355 [Oscillospiraceae bacterium]|nr:hypothetical protein [Oscillospiraceae bacterium]
MNPWTAHGASDKRTVLQETEREAKKVHLFLTGKVQVGKSTIIRKLIGEYPGTIGGFRTVKGPQKPDGGSDIFMMDVSQWDETDYDPSQVVARRIGMTQYEGYPEVFDRIGTALLTAAKGKDLIIMDELGFMEQEAYQFQKAVLDCLERNVPVLGVVKPASTEFLEQIHKHYRTTVLEVTEGNRGQVLEEVRQRILHPQYV